MNKKVFNLAMGVALASAPVYNTFAADVKVYGKIQAEYNVEDIDGISSEQGVDDGGGASKLGVKAVEELGSGFSAIALVEYGQDVTDGTLANNANIALTMKVGFVGLKHHKWGFLALGRFNSPYKMSNQVDPFNSTHLQAKRNGGGSGASGITGHNGEVNDAIYYRSPAMGGITFDVIISPDEKRRGRVDGEPAASSQLATSNTSAGLAATGNNFVKCASTSTTSEDDNDYSYRMTYKNGPMQAWMATAKNNRSKNTACAAGAFSTATGQIFDADENAIEVGAIMSMGNHTLAMRYEKISGVLAGLDNGGGRNPAGTASYSRLDLGTAANAAGVSGRGHIWFLGYQMKQGNNIYALQLGETIGDNRKGFRGNDTDYWAAGMIHKFSKKTKMFAGYSESSTNQGASNGVNNDREVFTVGLQKTF